MCVAIIWRCACQVRNKLSWSILPPLLPHFIEMHCLAHIYRSTGRAQGPADSSRQKLLAFPASTDCKSLVEPRRKPRTKHVHWPGAHVHSEADTADSALHLLGDADLGHLYFKFVPHVHSSKSLWPQLCGSSGCHTWRDHEKVPTCNLMVIAFYSCIFSFLHRLCDEQPPE